MITSLLMPLVLTFEKRENSKMGYYIECNYPTGKATQIVALGGRVIDRPTSFNTISDDDVLICVVENGPFDAAAVCYCESEFEEFGYSGDSRPKTWMLIPKKTVIALVPRIAGEHGPFREVVA